MNALINTFMESKKLSFNTSKCFVLHVGPKSDECCQLQVHDQAMKRTNSEKYLGDLVSNSGNADNIDNRRKIGMKTISELLSTLGLGGQ